MLLYTMLFVLAVADTTIESSCASCQDSSLGTNCFKVHGGPFQNKQFSIDQNYNSCDQINIPLPFSVTVKCHSCGAGNCQVSVLLQGEEVTFCTDDHYGKRTKLYLDNLYKLGVSADETYDWCGKASCGLGAGAIVGMTLGFVIVVGLIVGLLCYCRGRISCQ